MKYHVNYTCDVRDESSDYVCTYSTYGVTRVYALTGKEAIDKAIIGVCSELEAEYYSDLEAGYLAIIVDNVRGGRVLLVEVTTTDADGDIDGYSIIKEFSGFNAKVCAYQGGRKREWEKTCETLLFSIMNR